MSTEGIIRANNWARMQESEMRLSTFDLSFCAACLAAWLQCVYFDLASQTNNDHKTHLESAIHCIFTRFLHEKALLAHTQANGQWHI